MKYYRPFKTVVKSNSTLESVAKGAETLVAVLPKSATGDALPDWYKKAAEND